VFIDAAYAIDLRKLYGVTHIIFLNLSIDGRGVINMPFSVTEFGSTRSLGRKWIAEHDISLGVKNRKIINIELRKELATLETAPESCASEDMEQRDQAIEKPERRV
jgi:hypothetical protein